MRRVLRRHEAKVGSSHIALRNSGGIFIIPKFSHLMMDNGLVEVDIPEDYYITNREAIDIMVASTNKFIQNLHER